MEGLPLGFLSLDAPPLLYHEKDGCACEQKDDGRRLRVFCH